ncbi:MAG: zeta toxin family protein [Caulobacter sp.]
MPDAVLIAGANGAGKTTFAMNFVPRTFPAAEFLNADEIQQEGDAPISPMAAGREVLRRLAGHLERREDFAVETTLSSEGYARMFPAWRARGYRITLHYLEVRSADFAVARVARRVAAGGHAIPEDDIRRRHARGLALFERVYRPAVDVWYHYLVDEQGPRRVDQSQNAD